MDDGAKIPIKDSIATKMLAVVIGLYLLVTTGVTLSHVWMEYGYQKVNIIRDLGDIENAFEDGLAVSLWGLDEKALKATVEGMLRTPTLVGMKISNDKGATIAVSGIITEHGETGNVGLRIKLSGLSEKETTVHEGGTYEFEIFEHQFPIAYDHDGESMLLGRATIYSSSSIIYRKMKLQVAMLAANVVLTLLIFSLGLLLAVNRYLRRPLGILTSATASISLSNLGSFSIDTKTSGRDEIKVMEETITSMVAKLHDAILKREEVEASLKKAHEIGHIGAWDWDPNSGKLIWTDEVYQILGFSRSEVEPSYDLFLDMVHPEDKDFLNKSVEAALYEKKPYELDCRIVQKDGSELVAHALGEVQFDKGGKPLRMIGLIQDITERKKAEELIEHQATFDALTDLPNRRLLRDRIVKTLARCRRHGHVGAVLYIDLDNFKHINDSLGHPVGDQLLQEVTRRLKETIREEDTPARLGGDEFVVLFSELTDKQEEAAQLAQVGAEKIQKTLSTPFLIQEHELHVTSSIGIAIFPTDGENADDILKRADTAMYRAKEAGRNAMRFFLLSMQLAAEERLKLQNDLREALKRDEFHLHFQPQVDDAGRILGAEALLRWQHPVRGLVAPGDFIKVAEETGQILAIGEWVLENALIQLQTWTDTITNSSFKRLAINVSPRQFHEANFATQVERVLAETGAKPEYLTLEITEGILLQNLEDTIQKIEALKKLGIRFSIDDFGTGYSSLAYLRRLPLDEIKIDRSFVRDITVDPGDANLVETIITMAQNLGLEVIAEGVETQEQLHFLLERGCRYFQGYYFSHPQTVEAFKEHLCKPIKYTIGPSGSI